MLGIIIAAILGLAMGALITWLIIRKLPQDKIREINYARLQEEQAMLDKRKWEEEKEIQKLVEQRIQAYQDYENSRREVDEINRRISLLTTQKDILSNDVSHLAHERDDIFLSIEQSRKSAEDTAQTFLNQQIALVQEQLDKSLEQMAIKYQIEEEKYQQEYLQTVSESAEAFSEQMNTMWEKITHATKLLEQLRKAVDVAVANAKREEEKKQAKNFYRLTLPDSDLNEIAQLRAVEPFLRDKEALNKVIWKVYYEKPYTDLIGRVLGQGIKTGIYKITNMENQMCYVGQAVDVASRWKQHIKRGIGAEAPTRNKLYPAMIEVGVENFTFELLEECARDKLDEQEDYWQEFYHAKDFGYSIK